MTVDIDMETLHQGVSQTLAGIETVLKVIGTGMETYDRQTQLTVALLGSLTVAAGNGLAKEQGEMGLRTMKTEVEQCLAESKDVWMELLAGSQDVMLKMMMG